MTRSAESFASAKAERLKVSGNPSQYDHLDEFVADQHLIASLVEKSILQKLTVDISDNDLPRAVETIATWLEQTGGLYLGE